MNTYQIRREKCAAWMAENGVGLALFEDTEGRRDPAIRYLTGLPNDALLFLSADKRSLLLPWDINMANKLAQADEIIPYNDFGRQTAKALEKAPEYFKLGKGAMVEIPPVTPHPLFLHYQKNLPGFELICRNGGIYEELVKMRTIKDEEEIRIYRKVSAITNDVIDLLEKNVRDGLLKTESDAALFIEATAREYGCEGTGFETLAAGPERSFGIHAFPAYTAAVFGGKGLSILDFGLKYAGYTSDVTMTFARGASVQQEEQLALTEEAYRLALSLAKDGVLARDIGKAVDSFYAKANRTLPHGLGHGVGLEIHEEPRLNGRDDNNWVLKTGMIFTIEPGIYDPETGGCRLENDVLLTENGAEVLTKSRIVRL